MVYLDGMGWHGTAGREREAAMAARAEVLKQHLADMKRLPGVLGAALVSRDGIGALQDLPPAAQQPSFSAMTAAMLGAAEAALLQIGRSAPQRLIVDSAEVRLLVQGVTPELLLVVLAQPNSNLAALDAAIQAVAQQSLALQ